MTANATPADLIGEFLALRQESAGLVSRLQEGELARAQAYIWPWMGSAQRVSELEATGDPSSLPPSQ